MTSSENRASSAETVRATPSGSFKNIVPRLLRTLPAICGRARGSAAAALWRSSGDAVSRGWSDAQKRAYVIADNQLALNAGWDCELLALELGELKLGGFDLALIRFGRI